ncbi:DUF3693 domain-containing protein [Xylella fastidiosa subsp. multiplex]|uniref:DUF3693 domain-containing protein n=1 Tax=Xylella fastidiosa subsp. multiplex TaxID=644357 RepID=A0AAW6HVN6_XYLFS|nr:DUF3693 domain-containing protein [Xylella fastidiosa]MDC6408489.1 DUF3693 domain-containing protein [Xylella fastidiosa subsp. multiplex]MDD0936858.1 DUF3693 domain-containing protein [Xylella fastidiosa subsp. multiplex]MSS68330.1 hypothetical protein [Xylella fastidiosa subsp. multiplex]
MNSENILLDKVKEICSIKSDNALATKLGIQRQAIWKIRREEMHLSDERIAELCDMANLDGGKWAANIRSEKAESPKERAMWESIVERLTATAATLITGASVSKANESYANIKNKEELKQADKLVGRAGIEPATSGLKVRCTQED